MSPRLLTCCFKVVSMVNGEWLFQWWMVVSMLFRWLLRWLFNDCFDGCCYKTEDGRQKSEKGWSQHKCLPWNQTTTIQPQPQCNNWKKIEHTKYHNSTQLHPTPHISTQLHTTPHNSTTPTCWRVLVRRRCNSGPCSVVSVSGTVLAWACGGGGGSRWVVRRLRWWLLFAMICLIQWFHFCINTRIHLVETMIFHFVLEKK